MLRVLLAIIVLPAAGVLAWLALADRAQRADFVLAAEEPRTLDPQRVSWKSEIQLVDAMFEGLTRSDPATLAALPAVAERWDISHDGRVYTFHLRTDARWSNGDSVRAGDFRYSWLRVLEPATEAQYASLLFVVRGARAYYESRLNAEPGDDAAADGVGIFAADERTLRVELAGPCPYFLGLTAFATLMPVHPATVERYSASRATRHAWTRGGRMVSNGPFVLEDWEFKDRVRLRRNPHYWNRDAVHIQSIEALSIADPDVALLAYETGRIDFYRGLTTNSARAMLAAGRKDLHVGDRFATYFFRVNCARPPFDRPALRRALSLAIDKPALCAHVMGMGETPADTYVPRKACALLPGRAGGRDVFYEPPAGLGADMSYAERVEMARALLAESGFDPASRAIRLAFAPHADQQRVAEAVQAMWSAALGLRVELEIVEGKVLSERIRKLDYDVVRSDWFGDYLDPSTFLDMFTSDNGQNRTGWGNAEYDGLIAAAANEPDAGRRFALFRAAETILCELDVPIIPLFFKRGNFVLHPRWSGLSDNILDSIPLQRAVPIASN